MGGRIYRILRVRENQPSQNLISITIKKAPEWELFLCIIHLSLLFFSNLRVSVFARKYRGICIHVIRCRKEPNFKHSYDVVIGQVANDRVGTVVNHGLGGKMFLVERNKSWEMNSEPIKFTKKKGKTCEYYVKANRMEVSCGEAPYLGSRYDTITGDAIPLDSRIDLFDRKLRVVSENCNIVRD